MEACLADGIKFLWLAGLAMAIISTAKCFRNGKDRKALAILSMVLLIAGASVVPGICGFYGGYTGNEIASVMIILMILFYAASVIISACLIVELKHKSQFIIKGSN